MAFDASAHMEKSLASFKDALNTIRTGRASASIFDKVRVDYYGNKSPLNQVATITIPDARSVLITPFDKSLITELVKQAKTLSEQYKTTIRNVRRDGNDDLKKQQKASEITEDQLKKETDNLQKLTDKFIAEMDKAVEAKEKEILA